LPIKKYIKTETDDLDKTQEVFDSDEISFDQIKLMTALQTPKPSPFLDIGGRKRAFAPMQQQITEYDSEEDSYVVGNGLRYPQP